MAHPTPTFISPNLFGRDHITTFMFVETQVVNKGHFKLKPEPRMRTHRHNHRLVANKLGGGFGDKYGTRLSNGKEIMQHDDWDCIQDLAHFGFLCVEETDETDFQSIKRAIVLREYGKVTLTELGWDTANALRKYRLTMAVLMDLCFP